MSRIVGLQLFPAVSGITPMTQTEPPDSTGAFDARRSVEQMTVAELKDAAAARGIEIPAGCHKAELMELLSAAPPTEA